MKSPKFHWILVLVFMLAQSGRAQIRNPPVGTPSLPPPPPSLPVVPSGPSWNDFEKYQETLTQEDFLRLMDGIYCPSKKFHDYIRTGDHFIEFYKDAEQTMLDFTLYCAPSEKETKPRPPLFRKISEFHATHPPKEKPLLGLKITIDPGHIGGKWADTEERSVAWGEHPKIKEGDCNLLVARLLKARLQQTGAILYMTHEKPEPVTEKRTADFMEEARKQIFDKNKLDEAAYAARKGHWDSKILWQAELFFYRREEIAQRAANIRKHFIPDITLCIHLNATEKSGSGELVSDNRLALFMNGCYGPDEAENPQTRYWMTSKVLEQSASVEMAVGNVLSRKLLKIKTLPPARFGREKYQMRVNENPYLFARNLAASRQYPGPTLILEPFYMNNPWTAERLAAGDYDGVKTLSCGAYPSLFREYADAVADALIEAYGTKP